MKNQKNGFTLVELLAVIVILAIILLIAVPNILGVIEEAREDSFISSVKMIVKTAEYEELTRTNAGEHDVDLTGLDYDGTRYDTGAMNVNASGEVSVYLWSEELEICAFKDYDTAEVVIDETKDETTCTLVTVPATVVTTVGTWYDPDGAGNLTFDLMSDGTVMRNNYDASGTQIATPVQENFGGVRAVSISGSDGWSCLPHVFVLLEDGTVYGLGENNANQLGATLYSSDFAFTQITELTDIASMEGHGYGVIAITNSKNAVGTGFFHMDYSAIDGLVETITVTDRQGNSADLNLTDTSVVNTSAYPYVNY